ncbi:MAG: hypothetical protein ACMXYG_04995 [Candidatus Woesearchaeota archaeon]
MNFKEIWKKSGFWSAVLSAIMLFLGTIGAIMLAFGTCVFCLSAIAAFLLAVFGINQGVLVDFNIWFLGFGIFFGVLSVYLFMKRSKCKDGQCKVNFSKTHVVTHNNSKKKTPIKTSNKKSKRKKRSNFKK